jgi:hypothetical protein
VGVFHVSPSRQGGAEPEQMDSQVHTACSSSTAKAWPVGSQRPRRAAVAQKVPRYAFVAVAPPWKGQGRQREVQYTPRRDLGCRPDAKTAAASCVVPWSNPLWLTGHGHQLSKHALAASPELAGARGMDKTSDRFQHTRVTSTVQGPSACPQVTAHW